MFLQILLHGLRVLPDGAWDFYGFRVGLVVTVASCLLALVWLYRPRKRT